MSEVATVASAGGLIDRANANWQFYDRFERANGAPATFDSGQPWTQIAADGSRVVAAISSGKLVAADSGFSTTAAYSGGDMGAGRTVREMRARVSWLPGTGTDGGAGLIANPNGLSSVANITDLSLHIIFYTDRVSLGTFTGGVLTEQNIRYYGGTFSPVQADNYDYEIGWQIDGNHLDVLTPSGRWIGWDNAAFAANVGRYFTFETIYPTGGPKAQFHDVRVR